MRGVIDYSTNPNSGLYAIPMVLTPVNREIFGNQYSKITFQYFRLKKLVIRVTSVDPNQ